MSAELTINIRDESESAPAQQPQSAAAPPPAPTLAQQPAPVQSAQAPPAKAQTSVAQPAQASRMIDVRAAIEAVQGDTIAAFDKIKKAVQQHLSAGGQASLWHEDREIPITGIKLDMLRDKDGQPWGLLPAAMGKQGTKNGVELKGLAEALAAAKPQPALSNEEKFRHKMAREKDPVHTAAMQRSHEAVNAPAAEMRPSSAEESAAQAKEDAVYQARVDAYLQRRATSGKSEAKEFDPFKTAREHHEKKIRAEQVKAAHEEMYPEQKEQKSGLDAALDLAGKLRGTIGGTFGRLAGSMLDVVSAVRDASPKQPAKSAVRTEAERRNAEAREGPAQAGIPVAQHAPPGATAPARQTVAQSVGQAGQAVAKTVQLASGAGTAAAGAGAAGAAGAAMGLGALAAPVAIAAAASEAAKHLIRGAGDTAATLATLHDGADGLRATFGQMGGVVGEAANAIANLDDAVKATAERLGQYNGQLAVQNALQEVAVIQRDIQRANRMGSDVAGANQARFQMEQKLADITDRVVPFIMRMSKGIFDATSGMLTVLGALAKTGDTLVTAVPGGADFIAGALGREFFPLTTAVVKLLQAVNALKPEPDLQQDWENFIRAGNPFHDQAPQGAFVNAQPPLPGPVIHVP